MPRTTFNRYGELLAIADAQAGLITATQLAALGVATSTISRRTRPGGMWTRILPSVHLISRGYPTTLQREVAAMLYSGRGGVLTGLAALRHHGLTQRHDDNSLIQTLIPHDSRVKSTGFVLVERTRRLPDAVPSQTQPPLALAPPARAIGDASRHFCEFTAVHSLVTESLRRGITSIQELKAELATVPRQGSGHLREVLKFVHEGALSVSESDVLALIAAAGLPAPLLNRRLHAHDGRLIAIPDGWFDHVGLAYEVDSDRHHAFGADLDRTIRRNSSYTQAGILCLMISPRDIRDQPESVIRSLQQAYAAAAARPRPDVFVGQTSLRDTPANTPVRWGG